MSITPPACETTRRAQTTDNAAKAADNVRKARIYTPIGNVRL